MLLPSAMPGGPRPRLQRMTAYSAQEHTAQLSSPLRSSSSTPPPQQQGVGGACDALQSMLGTQRLYRSPKARSSHGALHSTVRSLKRPPPPSRSGLLRKRRIEDDFEDDDYEGSEASRAVATHGYGLGIRVVNQEQQSAGAGRDQQSTRVEVSTPKRIRRAPPSIPFGLDHEDFLNVDEGLDDAMSEEAATGNNIVLPVDEGYGSMEFEPSELKAALSSASSSASSLSPPRRTRATSTTTMPNKLFLENSSPFLRAPSGPASDGDAMSVSTPNSGLAALALSPGTTHHGVSDQTPSGLPSPRPPGNPFDVSSSLPSGPFIARSSSSSISPFNTDPIASPQNDICNDAATPDLPLPILLPSTPHTYVNHDHYHYQQSHTTRARRPSIHRLPSLAHSDPLLPTPCIPTSPMSPFASPPPTVDGDAVPHSTTLSLNSHHHHHQPQGDMEQKTPIAVIATTSVDDSTAARPSQTWTDADDRALVALVVDRMRLKKRDWDACARALGAHGNGASLGRRWRELVGDGCIGLRFRYGGALLVDRCSGISSSCSDGGNTSSAIGASSPAVIGRRIVGGVRMGGRARRGDVRAVRWS